MGIYSTRAKAEETIKKYKNISGFKDFPEDCFYLDEYVLDEDNWTDGFTSQSIND